MSVSDSAYDPFRRHDRYGTGGSKPQPWSEKAFLGLCTVLILPLKVTGAVTCLVWFYAFCRVSDLLPRSYRGPAVAAAGKLACRLCLLSLGFVQVKWIRQGQRRGPVKAAAIVSNHCSWLDILVHMSKYFPAFVARDATKDLTMIGLISQKMGCLFVDRERKGVGTQVGFLAAAAASATKKETIHETEEAPLPPSTMERLSLFLPRSFRQGVGTIVKERISSAGRGEAGDQRPMLLFPEGTTTNGRYLLPFKSGAFLAGYPVQPVILHYQQGRVSPSWESINALQHIWLILSVPIHAVTVIQLPMYEPSKEESEDPALYAKNVRHYMLDQCSFLKAAESTLADKRKFHEMLKRESSPDLRKQE